MNIPPRRGCGRPRRVSMEEIDEEATSTPQVSQYQNEPQVPLGFEPQAPQGFSASPILQPGFFLPMTPEAYQAYANFWYAQEQAQAQAGLGQFPMPPMTTLPQSSTTSRIKLSKLIKDARTLGCETFSETVDAVVARNWLKRVSDTLNDMELDDELKLKVATRLIDKSAATWWDNLKLRVSTPITWNLFVQEFNGQFYTRFHRDQKRKEFF